LNTIFSTEDDLAEVLAKIPALSFRFGYLTNFYIYFSFVFFKALELYQRSFKGVEELIKNVKSEQMYTTVLSIKANSWSQRNRYKNQNNVNKS
jgi:hypothetical protein